MEIDYNQISFCILASAFLTLGLIRSFKAYYSSIKSKKKPSTKNPMQIEIWISSYSSFTSVITFVGFATETYYYGARLLLNLVSISIGYIIAFLIIQPFFYNMKINSPYEYLQKRYGKRLVVRFVSAFFGILFRLSFSTLFLWANATVFSTIFPQCDLYISVIVIGCISVLFGLIGGLIQSMYINLLQITFFYFGVVIAISIAIILPGEKLTYYWNLAETNNRLNYIVTSGDLSVRYSIWNQIFSLPIPWCCFHGILTPHILRYKAIKSRARSSLFMISHLPIMFVVNSAAVFCGIFIYITFIDCDPYFSGEFKNKNQIASYFLIKVLDKKLPSAAGLCLASLFVYGIMQHSSGLSLSAQIFLNDILKPSFAYKYKKQISEKKLRIIKPFIVLAISVLSIFYALSFQYVKNSVISLFFLMNTSINAPMTSIFFLSMFNPYANHVGALASFIIAITINFWLGINAVTTALVNPKSQEFMQNTSGCNSSQLISVYTNNTYTPPNGTLFYLYSISSIWYSLFNLLFIIIFGSIFSLLYSLIVKRRVDLDRDYNAERKRFLFSFKNHFVIRCKNDDSRNSSLSSNDSTVNTKF